MKGLIALIVGVALTASWIVTPSVIADENGKVHSWSSANVPADRAVTVLPADRVITVAGPGMAMTPGTRVYLVNDDPAYDLSGSEDHWFLVGDGTAFHESSWRSEAAFVNTATGRHEVVPISAEYRQDWLAVAAGDRPVRTFTAPRSVMEGNEMAAAPGSVVYVMNGAPDNDRYRYSSARYVENGTRYRAIHPKKKTYLHRRTGAARYSAVKHHRHRAIVAGSHKRHRMVLARHSYRTATRTEYREPVAETRMAVAPAEPAETAEVEVTRDQMGHELFQMHSSWYMKNNGDWFRAESWRGPFVHVKKGMVPREVRMSAEHPSRIDMD